MLGLDFWPLGSHILAPQFESLERIACLPSRNRCKSQGNTHFRVIASMKAHPPNARSRYLATISTMEKVPVEELEAAPSESRWLWLLNAGDMAARARSGITQAENLPGSPVQIVELLAKVSESVRVDCS